MLPVNRYKMKMKVKKVKWVIMDQIENQVTYNEIKMKKKSKTKINENK